MGLTKSELATKLNDAFESIYGDWREKVVIDLTEYKITRESVEQVLKYKNEWLEKVNNENQYYECRIGSIARTNGDDTTNYLRLTCCWAEMNNFYVEYTYNDDSDTELLSDK